jgi:hypothetical protein
MGFQKNHPVIVVMAFVLLILNTPSSTAQDDCSGLADQVGHGGIIWTENAVVVQGTAAPNLTDKGKPISLIKMEAKRASTLDAYRKAAGLLAGIRLTSNTIVADHPKVMARIQAHIRGAKICKTKYYQDGGVDTVVKVPIIGAYAKEQFQSAGKKPAKASSKYTGLILDASMSTFVPAQIPRILAQNGRVLFDIERVKKEVLFSKGAVRYVADRSDIKQTEIGSNPIETKVAGIGIDSPSDLIVDQKTSNILTRAPAFLSEGKIAIIVPAISPLNCKNLAAHVKDAKIDWAHNLILARGRGAVDFTRDYDDSVKMRMMERAAEIDAQQKLMRAALTIKVDGSTRLEDISNVKNRITGYLANAVRCEAKYFADGSAEVVMATPLIGVAARSVDVSDIKKQTWSKTSSPILKIKEPGGIKKESIPVPVSGHNTPSPVENKKAVKKNKPQKPAEKISVTNRPPDTDATGLIIDASNTRFEPNLSPRLLSDEGETLFGPKIVARSYIQHYGVSGYNYSVEKARTDKRIGKNPMVIIAVKASQNASSLVLDGENTRRFKKMKNKADFLKQGRVIIVISES